MNTFNRIVVIVLDLVLLAGAIIMLLITFGVVIAQQVLPGGTAETVVGQWLASFATMPPSATLITTLGTALVIVLGLILLFYELRPAPQDTTIRIRDDGLGRVTVRRESVRDLILHTTAQLPDVLQVDPRIAIGQQGLTIACRTALTPDAHIPHVSADLQARIKQTVEQHLGMKVANVSVQAQLEPLTGVETRPRSRRVRRQLR
jgi:hypothetical protein